MLPNEEGSKMVLEIRDDEKMILTFFVYDFTKNEIQGQIVLEEKWWASIAYISKDVVVFKNYDNDANAKILSYEAYELGKLEKVWQKEGIAKVFFNNSTFSGVIENGDERAYNLKSGEALKDEGLNVEPNNQRSYSPLFYPQSNQYFETIKRFVNGLTGDEAVAAAEYIETKNWIGISYYERNDKLVNKLLVVSMDKEILLSETLAKELSGVGQDTFFVTDNKLIFVKDKSKFFIYQ